MAKVRFNKSQAARNIIDKMIEQGADKRDIYQALRNELHLDNPVISKLWKEHVRKDGVGKIAISDTHYEVETPLPSGDRNVRALLSIISGHYIHRQVEYKGAKEDGEVSRVVERNPTPAEVVSAIKQLNEMGLVGKNNPTKFPTSIVFKVKRKQEDITEINEGEEE